MVLSCMESLLWLFKMPDTQVDYYQIHTLRCEEAGLLFNNIMYRTATCSIWHLQR